MIHLIAQLAEQNAILYTYGPLGIVCAWLMYRDEQRAKDHRSLGHRIDGLTKALLVDMLERDTCGITTKRYARDEVAKIDSRLPRV